MKKTLMIVMFLTTIALSAHAQQTTMDLLTRTNWEPQNFFEEGDQGYIKYTLTADIYVEKIEGIIDRVSNSYYLSNTIENTFNANKVGSNNTGKYIIRKGPRYVFIAEIIELTTTKLVTRNLTPGFTTTGHITTYLATELNF